MPRERYQGRLAELRSETAFVGELVVEALREGLDALDRRDPAPDRPVADRAAEIRRRCLELERECIDLFALQQPVATDLRVVAATYKLLTDLERAGGLAANLESHAAAAEHELPPAVDVRRIGAVVVEMLTDALDAYAEGETATCWDVAHRDDEVEAACEAAAEAVVRELVRAGPEAADDSPSLSALLPEGRRLLSTLRDLERVGDHAVAVAARTRYLIEGDDVLVG
jgi:phosphate transport system protein